MAHKFHNTIQGSLIATSVGYTAIISGWAVASVLTNIVSIILQDEHNISSSQCISGVLCIFSASVVRIKAKFILNSATVK